MFDSISEFAACIFYDRTGPLLFALMMLCTLVVAKVLLSMRGGVVLTFHFAPFTCPITIPALAALPYSPSSLWLTTSEACYDAHSAAAMHVNEWLGKQQHALCPCHVAFVRLGRAWVAQVVGGLRVFCGSSCVAVGCAVVSGVAACECHPQAMVGVLAKTSFATFTFSQFWLPTIACATGVLVYTRRGACAVTVLNWSRDALWLFALALWKLPFGTFVFDSAVLTRQCV